MGKIESDATTAAEKGVGQGASGKCQHERSYRTLLLWFGLGGAVDDVEVLVLSRGGRKRGGVMKIENSTPILMYDTLDIHLL